MRESSFERRVCERVKSAGGKALKWVSPGFVGAPDRIIIMPGGKIVFAEIKRPGRVGGLSPRQVKVFQWLRDLGCSVYRVGNEDELNAMMEEVLPNDI